MGPPARSLPETVAAVDLGSNSFHMIVARPLMDGFVVQDRLREMVQLAAGLDRANRITSAARGRAIECLRRFGQRLGPIPGEGVRAVGTNTLRTARNARRFLADAEKALGHSIETISGIEEARLIFLGVTHSLPDPAVRRLVVDIGGGSTELIVGENHQPSLMESLYVGCVTLGLRHFPDGAITTGRWRKAEVAALQELEPFRARYRAAGWKQAVGASGTVRAAMEVIAAEGWNDNGGITMKALRRLRDVLLKAGHVDRISLPGLSPTRAPVFPGGVVLLTACFETLGIESMGASDGALREGLLHDLLGRIGETDVRERSIATLAERFHVDRDQASRVATTSLRLLDEVEGSWDLNARECRRLLTWAATLHEIGLDIAHQHYHMHGEYVIGQADLPGFSREEQSLVAKLVRAHRRKFQALSFEDLPPGRVHVAERLAILLRMAVILHRSRSPDPLPALRIKVKKRTLRLDFPDDWLEEHPLTRADLEQESSWLRDAGIELAIS